MKMMIFFDLPMTSNKEIRIYTKFRKFLLKNGYIMLQYSVYCKTFNNIDAAHAFVKVIRKNVPCRGNIRIMIVTEKQYNDIEIIVGGKSNQESKITIDPLVLL